MRGTGTLRTIIGRPIIGKKKQQDDSELLTAPKRQNKRKSAGPGAGQSSIFNFFQAVLPRPADHVQRQEGVLPGAAYAAASNEAGAAAAADQQSLSIRASLDSDTVLPSAPFTPAPLSTGSQQQLTATQPTILQTRVVGRQHQTASWPPADEAELELLREPHNPVDGCAILVCSTCHNAARHVHGHLPAPVSCHLAPLLDAGTVSITARLAKPAVTGSTAPIAASRTASSRTDGSSRMHARQHQQLQHLELHVAVAAHVEDPQEAASIGAAVSQAAVAGLESLQPRRSSASVLTAAFEHILQQTRQHELHLLDDSERKVLEHMQALPAAPKALLLHLLLRKRTWFPLSSISYADVPDPAAAASRLSAVGLLQWDSELDADLDGLLQDLAVPVLKQILAAVLPKHHPALQMAAAAGSNGSSGPSKAAVIASIQANVDRSRLQAAVSAATGPCVAITPAAASTFMRLQLMYFASPGQDLGMFVAADRGAVRYPSYPIHRTRPVFASRHELMEYEAALQLAAKVDEVLEEGDNESAWQLIQPALAALAAGVHKAIFWDESCAPMPNPPPAMAAAVKAATEHHESNAAPQEEAAQAASQPAVRPTGAEQEAAAAAQVVAPMPILHPPKAALLSGVGDGSKSGHSSSQGRSQDDDARMDTCDTCDLACASSSEVSWCYDSAESDAGWEAEAPASEPGSAAQTQQATSPPQPVGAGITAAAAAAARASAVAASAGGPAPPPLFLARFCAGWVHASLGTVAISLLEKQKRWVEAVDLLRLLLGGNACVGRRGDWWTRLAINLEHLGRADDALEAVEAALADSWVRGGDLLGLQRRLLRLGKPPRRWKRPPWAHQVMWEPPELVISARPLNTTTGTKSRFYGPDGSLVTVEQLALQHYASEEGGGWLGLHSEGGVYAALFGLLLWDVLFMGAPDVFRSPFQTCPLDLGTDAFYPTRQHQLDLQLTRIADGQAGEILSSVWASNVGVFARGINWQRFTKQQLLEICDCIGGLGLSAVLRLMAEDHAGATGGLPDLLLWRPSSKSAKMVEVKGPRDRLSHQQRFWLSHMANSNLQVEVLKVKEPGGKKK